MSKIKICLDAGHYGKYNRSPVVKEYYESDMAWELHLLLKKHLEAYGIEVIQTRSSQAKDLELTARGKKSKGCDLFLSLHSNAASSENVDYVVGLYQVDDNCGDMDEQSKVLAKKLADCVGEVMGAEAKSWSTKSSSDRDGNGYKDDYYGVLRGAHSVGTAGVIIEHGFHTNKAQAEWLLKDSNLDKLAKAEAKVIAEHYGYYGTENSSQKGMVEVKVSVLKKGAKGNQVKALQALLIGYGYSCGSYGVDGSFGSATDKAVRAYQKANGLEVDGSVGPVTWSKLLGV
jgi:N-acetylmuramoyl-L-alanine amidase